MKQGMIVVGGADVDGKAYADGETGYGKGMFYGQPSGMMWPGKDGKQGMIVVGGAEVDGKAYADGETGYGKGMYYGQPSGMMWPGMEGKINSDADVNALTDGT